MPRASETIISVDPQPTPVGVRQDGAIICKGSLPRGRCNKLVVTKDGDVRCPNGHPISLADVLCAALNRADASRNVLAQFHPFSSNVRPLMKRLASPEFLNASPQSWQHHFLIDRLDIFADVIIAADHFEPECSVALRAYWERELGTIWTDVSRCLQLLKEMNTQDYFCFRERALHAFRRWGIRDPLRYLAWSEVSLEAVERLGGEAMKCAVLYRHNIEESVRLMDHGEKFPDPALLYFCKYRQNTGGECFIFTLILDPYWSHPGWRLDMQIGFSLLKEQSSSGIVAIDLSIYNTLLRKKFFQEWAKRVGQKDHPNDSIRYIVLGYDKMYVSLPHSMMPANFENPESLLELMKGLQRELCLRMPEKLEV